MFIGSNIAMQKKKKPRALFPNTIREHCFSFLLVLACLLWKRYMFTFTDEQQEGDGDRAEGEQEEAKIPPNRLY